MDVYILFDPRNEDPEDAVLSVHARRQGADLAAIEYADQFGESEYPATGSRERSVRMLYERLVIVNRDVQDLYP